MLGLLHYSKIIISLFELHNNNNEVSKCLPSTIPDTLYYNNIIIR